MSEYFSEVGNDLFPERLIVSKEDDVAGLQAKIARVDYLFVITDVEDLELAKKVAKIIKITKTPLGYQFPLITFGILCPTADDVRLADLQKKFGTWIILPEDKIAETGLTSNELINRTINVTASPVIKGRIIIGMDFDDVVRTIGNGRRACIGFGKSLDSPLDALKMR